MTKPDPTDLPYAIGTFVVLCLCMYSWIGIGLKDYDLYKNGKVGTCSMAPSRAGYPYSRQASISYTTYFVICDGRDITVTSTEKHGAGDIHVYYSAVRSDNAVFRESPYSMTDLIFNGTTLFFLLLNGGVASLFAILVKKRLDRRKARF